MTCPRFSGSHKRTIILHYLPREQVLGLIIFTSSRGTEDTLHRWPMDTFIVMKCIISMCSDDLPVATRFEQSGPLNVICCRGVDSSERRTLCPRGTKCWKNLPLIMLFISIFYVLDRNHYIAMKNDQTFYRICFYLACCRSSLRAWLLHLYDSIYSLTICSIALQ